MIDVQVSSEYLHAMADVPGSQILVTGALGQIGSDLTTTLQGKYGKDSVLTTDIHDEGSQEGPFQFLDVLDYEAISKTISEYSIDTIYHLAAVLSAHGEKDPDLCEKVNLGGLQNILDAARNHGCRVFAPSSIAVFGPDSRPIAMQHSSLSPTTVYGRTKKDGEEMMLKYFHNYGVDVRGLRYPGLLSWTTPPTGGTTDYAVRVFFEIHANEKYDFFVREDTKLPMMMMQDAIRATMEIMSAPSENLSRWRSGYNIRGISFSASELANCIRSRNPNAEMRFIPDERQEIADNWPEDVDDAPARNDWGWQSRFDLEELVDSMIAGVAQSSSSF